jgi:SAM-dependent methyltransferase
VALEVSGARPDPRGRFSNRVEDYLQGRPGYPSAVATTLVERFGVDASWTVADIGAGTGIASVMFLELGCTVIAVEPNRAMREAARLRLGGSERFRPVDAAAESTSLDAASVDLVVVAQAFHWFDKARFRAESLRILRPGGVGALIWNVRIPDATPFAAAYESLVREFATDYLTVRHENVSDDEIAAYFGGPYERTNFANLQRLDRGSLRARLTSSSYLPAAGDARFAAMQDAMETLFANHEQTGFVELPYEARLYAGRVRDDRAT